MEIWNYYFPTLHLCYQLHHLSSYLKSYSITSYSFSLFFISHLKSLQYHIIFIPPLYISHLKKGLQYHIIFMTPHSYHLLINYDTSFIVIFTTPHSYNLMTNYDTSLIIIFATPHSYNLMINYDTDYIHHHLYDLSLVQIWWCAI